MSHSSSSDAFKCRVPGCGRSSLQLEHLRQHGLSSHTASAPKVSSSSNAFRCGVPGCGKSFRQLEALRQHGLSHKVSTPKVSSSANAFKCGVPGCGRSFRELEHLRQHELSHSTTIAESISKLALRYLNTTPTAHNYQPIAPQHTPSPPPVPRTVSFFRHPVNVDARHSEFNQVIGSQNFIGSVHVANPDPPVNLTPRSSSPPPPYKQ
jgi:hypothetical protein